MKIKDFNSSPRLNMRSAPRLPRGADGPNIATALLGVLCVTGVFGLLALLYHFG